jgi:hypothetical protein
MAVAKVHGGISGIGAIGGRRETGRKAYNPHSRETDA